MMKGIAFQLIASSVALAVMGGMVGTHWWKLGSAEGQESRSDLQVLAAPADLQEGMMPVSTGGGEAVPSAQVKSAGPDSVHSATLQAFQEVVSVLKDLKTQNEELREQLMEANEDLNGMQIQLDGYSQEFKPLKLAPTPEGVYDSGNPLLPPKSW